MDGETAVTLIEAVAQAIHNADYANEPWKKFETLHPDDADHYRDMALAAVAAFQSFQVAAIVAGASTGYQRETRTQ